MRNEIHFAPLSGGLTMVSGNLSFLVILFYSYMVMCGKILIKFVFWPVFIHVRILRSSRTTTTCDKLSLYFFYFGCIEMKQNVNALFVQVYTHTSVVCNQVFLQVPTENTLQRWCWLYGSRLAIGNSWQFVNFLLLTFLSC